MGIDNLTVMPATTTDEAIKIATGSDPSLTGSLTFPFFQGETDIVKCIECRHLMKEYFGYPKKGGLFGTCR